MNKVYFHHDMVFPLSIWGKATDQKSISPIQKQIDMLVNSSDARPLDFFAVLVNLNSNFKSQVPKL